jgi:hypothetical protein
MMSGIRGNVFLIVASILFMFAFTVFAETDPPDRVARLNLIEGSVSFHPSGGDNEDWVSAVLNRPLTTGDRLWTDANSRSELHIGSTAIRMDSHTGISFLSLDSTNTQIRLSNGSINIKLRYLERENTFEVDTPNLAFSIRRPGNYRIDALPDTNTTIVTVWQGQGEAIGGGRSWHVISDQQALFTGISTLDYDLRDPEDQSRNAFDKWARNRDTREDRAPAKQYVPREMTGYEDLDSHGDWRHVPDYGWCWAPTRVAVDWAPYRYGNWVWISPWGWTWVDDAPWGFAPFHYGRWMHRDSTWLWVPGPINVRPVYAPALVAWVGGGNFNISVSIGSRGGIGWFPLGPREVFVPTYHVSERYITNINITNTVVKRETVLNTYNNRDTRPISYINRTVRDAVTMVERNTFVNSRPVAKNNFKPNERELAVAPVSHRIDVAPERLSVLGAGNRNAARPPEKIMNLPVVTKQVPPAEPNHFKQIISDIRQNMPAQSAPTQRPTNQPPERSNLPFSNPNTRSDRSSPTVAPRMIAPPERSVSPDSGANPRSDRPAPAVVPRTIAPPERSVSPDSGPNPRSDRPAPAVVPRTIAPPERNVSPDSGPNPRFDRSSPTAAPRTKAPPEAHPLAKPAPQVKAATPKEKNDVDVKQKIWEKLRQKRLEKEGKDKDSK